MYYCGLLCLVDFAGFFYLVCLFGCLCVVFVWVVCSLTWLYWLLFALVSCLLLVDIDCLICFVAGRLLVWVVFTGRCWLECMIAIGDWWWLNVVAFGYVCDLCAGCFAVWLCVFRLVICFSFIRFHVPVVLCFA